jgi:hypothetical protein
MNALRSGRHREKVSFLLHSYSRVHTLNAQMRGLMLFLVNIKNEDTGAGDRASCFCNRGQLFSMIGGF